MTNDDDVRARNRYFTISATRLIGTVLVMAGFILIAGKWELLGADVDRIVGVALVLMGLADIAIVPRILARRWKSPTER